MERADLRVVDQTDWDDYPIGYRPVTDADLASLGYVKLDGIDVEALRKLRGWNMLAQRSRDALDGVLAALDQEDSDAP